MKKVELKVTSIDTANGKLNYRDLILSVLNRPMPEGIRIKDMRDRLRLYQIFEDVVLDNGVMFVDLSEEDIEILKQGVNSMDGHWSLVHREILDFVDYINSL